MTDHNTYIIMSSDWSAFGTHRHMDISDQIVELLLSQLKILLVECDTRSFAAKLKKVGFKEHYMGHNNKGKMIL